MHCILEGEGKEEKRGRDGEGEKGKRVNVASILCIFSGRVQPVHGSIRTLCSSFASATVS